MTGFHYHGLAERSVKYLFKITKLGFLFVFQELHIIFLVRVARFFSGEMQFVSSKKKASQVVPFFLCPTKTKPIVLTPNLSGKSENLLKVLNKLQKIKKL